MPSPMPSPPLTARDLAGLARSLRSSAESYHQDGLLAQWEVYRAAGRLARLSGQWGDRPVPWRRLRRSSLASAPHQSR